MSDRFTDSIEPLALATQGRTIEGRIPLGDLERVLPLLRSNSGEVVFNLKFDTDEAGMPRIRGTVQTTLVVQCQRCMEDMELPVSSQVRLGIVASREAAEQLPDNYEPLVCNDETTIVSVLEDELILALPIVAMHKIEDCPVSQVVLTNESLKDEQNKASTVKKNPFAVLAQLKNAQSEDKTD